MTKIIYKTGDVTEASEPVIVHGCNAQGVMGSGVAKAIREKFPYAYDVYKDEYNNFGLYLGQFTVGRSFGDKTIVNMVTQERFGRGNIRYMSYDAVYEGFLTLNGHFFGTRAIAMPQIGAGLGGGNWNIIAAIIEETSTNYQPVVYTL